MKRSSKIVLAIGATALAGAYVMSAFNTPESVDPIEQKIAKLDNDMDAIASKLAVVEAMGAVAIGTYSVSDDRFRIWLDDGEDKKDTGLVTEYNFASQMVCEGPLEDPAALKCNKKFSAMSERSLSQITVLACNIAADQKQQKFLRDYCTPKAGS